MVSAAMTWKGISGQFFVGKKRSKKSENLFLEHLKNEMTPSLEQLCPTNDFILIREGATSNRVRKVPNFLKERLNSHFAKNVD